MIRKDMNGWHYLLDGQRIPVSENGFAVGKTPAILLLYADGGLCVWFFSVRARLVRIEEARNILRQHEEYARLRRLEEIESEMMKAYEKIKFLGSSPADGNATLMQEPF